MERAATPNHPCLPLASREIPVNTAFAGRRPSSPDRCPDLTSRGSLVRVQYRPLRESPGKSHMLTARQSQLDGFLAGLGITIGHHLAREPVATSLTGCFPVARPWLLYASVSRQRAGRFEPGARALRSGSAWLVSRDCNSEGTSPSSAGASASGTRGRLLAGPPESYQLAPPVVEHSERLAAGRRPVRKPSHRNRWGPGNRALVSPYGPDPRSGAAALAATQDGSVRRSLGRSSSNPPYGGSPDSPLVRPLSPGHSSIRPSRGR